MNVEIMDTNLDHRNFLLNLSTEAGQYIAAGEGFVPPSAPVQWRENIDVVRNWRMIKGARLMPFILQSAQWMLTLTQRPTWDYEKCLFTFQTYTSLMVSHLVQLHEAGMIQFAHTPEIEISLWNEEAKTFKPMDTVEYSDKDLIGYLDFEPDLTDEVQE